jgi:hypothetical protein
LNPSLSTRLLPAALLLALGAARPVRAQQWSFCTDAADGGGVVDHDPWRFGNGVWLVKEWLYHPAHTHDRALRVDGVLKYSTLGGDCPRRFPSAVFGSAGPNGPGFATWTTPEGEVTETLSEAREGGCCGLLVEIRVENTDTVPHSYEWRTYHDTAFGDAVGSCLGFSPTVDGGPIEIGGTQYIDEVDLLAHGAASGCAGQVKMFSGEDLTLHATFELLPPNMPTDFEHVRWNEGAEPCTTWSGLVDGSIGTASTCTDNSLLMIWRFPQGTGTLLPGESAGASYRIGWKCAWPCAGCEFPSLTTGTTDETPCNLGVHLTWQPATFPGAGNGVYHVYRSETSFADALLGTPVTPAGGLATPELVDLSTTPGGTYFYVVRAESTDFPGCGPGPLVGGSTADLALGPITDAADLDGPATDVGGAVRATGHAVDAVTFAWTLAPPPGPGETYLVLRSDDDASVPFTPYDRTPAQVWTDGAAPARFPRHVWFYDVRMADACGNLSRD